jgi:glycosyltransferase involved in cell wall biosynthesis
MDPTASIIITCYNLAAYIGEAIASAAAQDFDGTTEIIVVDDASSDSSPSVIAQFPDVRMIRMERNSGSMLALLAGIEAARGEHLVFLDGDDVWEPRKLRRVMALSAQDPAMVLATHDLSYIDSRGQPIATESRVAKAMAAIPPDRWSEAIREGILAHCDYVWLGSAFAIRRSLARLDDFAAFVRGLPEPREIYQDWPLAFWCASLAGPSTFGFSPEKLFRYRLHQANHSGDARTSERASRNFRRSARTLEAMELIAALHRVPASFTARLERRRAFYEWVAMLYEGRRASSAIGYPAQFPFLIGERRLIKESLRFAGIQLLGPDRFARLAARVGNGGPASSGL